MAESKPRKKAAASEKSPTAPVKAMLPKEACEYFIRSVSEGLRELNVRLQEGDYFSNSKAHHYISCRGPREERGAQCVPRIYLRPHRQEVGAAQFEVVIENTHVCHPAMVDSLKKMGRIWNRSFQEEKCEASERIYEVIDRDSVSFARIILIHYLRVRQACVECMAESDRLKQQAEQFVTVAVDEAMNN